MAIEDLHISETRYDCTLKLECDERSYFHALEEDCEELRKQLIPEHWTEAYCQITAIYPSRFNICFRRPAFYGDLESD